MSRIILMGDVRCWILDLEIIRFRYKLGGSWNSEVGMRPALARRLLVCTTTADSLKKEFLSFELSLESRSGPGKVENMNMRHSTIFLSAFRIPISEFSYRCPLPSDHTCISWQRHKRLHIRGFAGR